MSDDEVEYSVGAGLGERISDEEGRRRLDEYVQQCARRRVVARGRVPRPHIDLDRMMLARVALIDGARACQLLGTDRLPRDVLRYTVDGQDAYPRFQFDGEARRIYPALVQIRALQPSDWSDTRLLHWLSRPHLDLGAAPMDVLETEGAAVIAAFLTEIEPPQHG